MANPWERYQAQPSGNNPWDRYPTPQNQNVYPGMQPSTMPRIDPDPGALGIAMDVQPHAPPPTLSDRIRDLGGYLDLAANGLTFGAWPHVAAALQGGIPGMFSEQGFAGGYQNELEGINANMADLRQRSPLTSAAAEMGGAMLPAMFTAGTWAAPTVMGRVGQGATLGLGGGALYGYLEGDAPIDDPSRAQNAVDYGGWGLGLGATMPLAFEAAPALRRAARSVVPSRAASRAADFSEDALRSQAAEYRSEARQIYDELDRSGVRIDRQAMDDSFLQFMTANEEGLIETPAAERFLNTLISRTARYGEMQGGVPLGTLERWRQELNRKISDAWGQSRGEEAQMFERIQENVDNMILGHSDGAQREMWLYTMRFDALADAATRAADRATGTVTYDEALRRQLRTLKNGRLWDRFTPEQQAAITEAIRSQSTLGGVNGLVNRVLGGGLQRTLSNALGLGGAIATSNPAYAAPALLGAFSQSADARALNRRLQDVAKAMNNPNGLPALPAPSMDIPLLAYANIPAVARGYATGGGF